MSSSLKLSENSEMKQDVFLAIVKDCVKNGWQTPHEFTKEETKKYHAIEKARGYGFWGGYAYLDEPYDGNDFVGLIRIYCPYGKLGFEVKGDEVNVFYG
jgi:hypothetical protein